MHMRRLTLLLGIIFLAVCPGLVRADTLSGGTFVVNGGVSSISGSTALTGGSFIVNGIVAPIGGSSSGGTFQSNPPLGLGTGSGSGGSSSSGGGGNGSPFIFGSNGGPGAPQFLSITITPGVTRALVSFTTDIASEAQISFGSLGFPLQSTARDPSSTSHLFVLEGLRPESLYSLTISVFSGNTTNVSAPLQFSTLGTIVETTITKRTPQATPSGSGAAAVGTAGTQASGASAGTAAAGGKPVLFTGVVQDPAGHFLAGVEVRVSTVSSSGEEVPVYDLLGKIVTDDKGTFSFTAPPGANYVIEASLDLQFWTPVQTNALPSTGLDVSLPLIPDQNLCFRARLAP